MREPAKSGRERILETTLELVIRQGFAATTVDQILEKTGLTKGAFFYHFKSKDDLASALVERWVELDLALLADVRSRAEKLVKDPLQQLFLGGGGRKAVQAAFDANPLAGEALVFDVDRAGGIVADQHGSQARRLAVVLDEVGHGFGELQLDLGGERFAVENGGGQAEILVQTAQLPVNFRAVRRSPIGGATLLKRAGARYP